MNQEINTFESICAGRGEPIEVFDIVSPPERDIRCGKFIPSPDPVRVGIWRLPDDIEGGLMVCGTYHTGAPFQWHYNSGERSAVAHLLADRDRLRSELDAARAELARVRRAYIRQIERRAAKHCDEWAQVIRSMGCRDPGSYQGRRWTRIRKVRDACRAELARMGEP